MEPKLSLLPANSLSILAVVAFASIRLSFSRTACPLPTSERALAGLRFGREADLEAVISAHSGPCDLAILKFHSDDIAVVRQHLTVHELPERRTFVPRSNFYLIARVPVA